MSAGPVPHAQDFLLVFPATRCCNCGKTDGLHVKMQDTKFIRDNKGQFFGSAGDELTTQLRPLPIADIRSLYSGIVRGTILTFKLPLPVCNHCEDSLLRRPATNINKLFLLFVIAIALLLVAVTVGADAFLNTRFHLISNHLFPSCLVVAALLLKIFYSLRRPVGHQTSYYQPVRIGKCESEYSRGQIQQIGFLFTNPAYRHDFLVANKEAIWSESVLAESL
jgi:hypothetical protein